MRNKILFLMGVMVLATVLAACGGAATAQGLTPTPESNNPGSNPRTLSVSGNGKAYLTPDIAYVNIGVHTEGEDAAQSVANNNTQSQQVIDALRRFGIDAKDIQTTNFSIYPQRGYDNQGQPVGEIRYVVDNTVYVTVRDLDQIGELLDSVVQSGANSVNGIQFDVANRASAMAEARKAAVADARAQAEELAEAAGVTLGEIYSINAYTTGYPVPYFEGRGGAMQDAAAAPINPGQLTISLDVNVVYTIR